MKAITEEEYKHALESLVERAQQRINFDGTDVAWAWSVTKHHLTDL